MRIQLMISIQESRLIEAAFFCIVKIFYKHTIEFSSTPGCFAFVEYTTDYPAN